MKGGLNFWVPCALCVTVTVCVCAKEVAVTRRDRIWRFVMRREQESVRCYGNMSFTWLWNRSMGSTCTKHLNSRYVGTSLSLDEVMGYTAKLKKEVWVRSVAYAPALHVRKFNKREQRKGYLSEYRSYGLT